jgi:phosphatidylinositol 3-kinase
MTDARRPARPPATTTQFTTNFKIELKSLIVDVRNDIEFDIYSHFGIVVPKTLIEDWDSDAPLPFRGEVECILMADNRILTCPITSRSAQYTVIHPTFPNISALSNIAREQHTFTWDTTIELPISYAELPLDSVLSFKFYARLFQTSSRLIGVTSVRLFTHRSRHFRSGPFTLTFDNTSETRLQKHIRRIATGKAQSYEFIDDQLRCVSESLHPSDADNFFKALLRPFDIPELSRTAQFVRINVSNPAPEPSTVVTYADLVLKPIDSYLSLNPCQRLYHDLAHAQGPANSALLKDSNITETLNKVKAMTPLSELTPVMKNTIYNHCGHCLSDPALMPALFRSVNWDDEEEAHNLATQLLQCKPIDVEYALEFFTRRYDQKPIREFAVRCIRSVERSELFLYIPQLLQAVKAKFTSGLGEILVSHAADDILFASRLYWMASIEARHPPENEQIRSLMTTLMESLPPESTESIDRQRSFVKDIYQLIEVANQGKSPTPQQIRDKVRDLLLNDPELSKLQHFDKLRLPLEPSLFAVGIDPQDIRVFASKLRPVMLSFVLDDGQRYRVIFKIGDDMQQDQLIIQLFEVMDHVFQRASLRLPITAYRTLAFSPTFGCCQFIDNSRAIRDINAAGQKIRDFLEEDHEPIEPKIEKFTASLAAYCVMTYVLKIGDRHDNNILVTRDGRLLHIDYGYILGDVTKPFTPPLKLSQEMVDTIGSDGLQRICGWAGPAFNSLRKRARLILVLIELMFTAPLTCFQQNPMRRLQQVENSLLLNCTEIEAMNSLQATFSESLNSRMQVFWEHVHIVAMATGASSAEG